MPFQRYKLLFTHSVLGLAFLLTQGRVEFSGLELQFATPVFTQPEFSLNALLSMALPLFLITSTGQYMPGMRVLRNDGFSTSTNPIVTITGLGSLLMAPSDLTHSTSPRSRSPFAPASC
jgi:benzoate membrane transport protein